MLRKIMTVTVVLGVIGYLAGLVACQQVPAEIGASSKPRALQHISDNQHPFLAESQRSSMHGGAHNWDINTYPGPLGRKTTAKHRKFSNIIGVAPNISFDSQGRLITVSIKLNSIELHLLDPETLETIAMLNLPPKASASDNSGGGYFHIDAKDRVLLAPANDTISIYEISESSGSPKWQLGEQYDIAGLLPEGTNIHDVIPDWSGNLWFVTGGAYLGYRDQGTGKFYTYELPAEGETIQNSFAVDEEGLYVASTDAIYQFQIDDDTKEPFYTWREDYENGTEQKPGTLSHGSGTSPTLIGHDLVAIADDGDPFTNIVVYQRSASIEGDRLICKVPLFEQGKSATENSLLVYGNAMVVQNDYGHIYTGNALKTSPGIMRVDVRDDRSGCDVVWHNETFLSQSLPRLSTETGLLYFYTFQKQKAEDFFGGWYLSAVDWETGESLWDRLIGRGTGSMIDTLSSVTAPIVLGPNGAAYAGIRTGVIMAKDAVQKTP
jgi:hypothetical protein